MEKIQNVLMCNQRTKEILEQQLTDDSIFIYINKYLKDSEVYLVIDEVLKHSIIEFMSELNSITTNFTERSYNT